MPAPWSSQLRLAEEGSSGVSERAWDNIPTLLPAVLNQDSSWLPAHLQQTSGVSSPCPVKLGKVIDLSHQKQLTPLWDLGSDLLVWLCLHVQSTLRFKPLFYEMAQIKKNNPFLRQDHTLKL